MPTWQARFAVDAVPAGGLITAWSGSAFSLMELQQEAASYGVTLLEANIIDYSNDYSKPSIGSVLGNLRALQGNKVAPSAPVAPVVVAPDITESYAPPVFSPPAVAVPPGAVKDSKPWFDYALPGDQDAGNPWFDNLVPGKQKTLFDVVPLWNSDGKFDMDPGAGTGGPGGPDNLDPMVVLVLAMSMSERR